MYFYIRTVLLLIIIEYYSVYLFILILYRYFTIGEFTLYAENGRRKIRYFL